MIDLITTLFECLTAFSTWSNVRALRASRLVAGVSLKAYLLSYIAGCWAWFILAYAGLWLSVAMGGVWFVGATCWLLMAWRFRAKIA